MATLKTQSQYDIIPHVIIFLIGIEQKNKLSFHFYIITV